MNVDFGQRLINVDVRPIRLGYLIRDASDFREAVAEASSRWGGVQDLMVPVGKDGTVDAIAHRALERHPVDYFVMIGPVSALSGLTLPMHLLRPVLRLTDLELQGGVHATHVDHGQGPPTFDRGAYAGAVTRSVVGAPTNASPLLLASLGVALTAEQEAAWNAIGMAVTHPLNDVQLVGAQLTRTTLILATASQCGETLINNGLTSYPTVLWLAARGDVAEAIAFWNLRAMLPLTLARADTCFAPDDLEVGADLKEVLARAPRSRPHTTNPDYLVWTPGNRRAGRRFASRAGLRVVTDTRVRTEYPAARADAERPRTTWVNRSPLGLVPGRSVPGVRVSTMVHLQADNTVIHAEAPVRWRTTGYGTVRVRFSGSSMMEIPTSPSAARLFHANAVPVDGHIEVETGHKTRIHSRSPFPRGLMCCRPP